MFFLVTGCECLAAGLAVLLCRLLGWGELRVLIPAAMLVTPVPVAQVSSGVAGFVYVADVASVGMLLVLLMDAVGGRVRLTRRSFVFGAIAMFLLVLLPVVAASGAAFSGGATDVRSVGLGVFRGVGYLAIFLYCARLALSGGIRLADLFRVQVLVFAFVCAVGCLQFAGGPNVDLWNEVSGVDHGRWTYGYGAGFMGLYRGAVGAWGALLLTVAPPAFLTRRWGVPILIAATGLIGAGMLIVGSRQGVVLGGIGLLSGIGVALRYERGGSSRRQNSTRMLRKVVLLAVIATLSGAVAARALGGSRFSEWVSSRFVVLTEGVGAIQESERRDLRMWSIAEKIASNPIEYVIGIGDGHVVPEAPGDEYDLVYVDSELFWTVQRIGFLGLVSYLVWLGGMVLAMFRTKAVQNIAELRSVGALLGLGACLLYGHFFLLHVQSSQAPISYWLWGTSGLALGIAERGRRTAKAALKQLKNIGESIIGVGNS